MSLWQDWEDLGAAVTIAVVLLAAFYVAGQVARAGWWGPSLQQLVLPLFGG